MATPSNADRELHNPEVTNGNLIKERTTSKPAGALRGAAGGIYIGPVLSVAAIGDAEDGSSYVTSTTVHAIGGTGAGGIDGSTGYRKSNTWGVDGDATGWGMGVGGTRTLRPNPGGTADGGRQMFRGDGLNGGSVAGYPAQKSGQRAAAATASSLTAEGGASAIGDKRSDTTATGGRALGSGGRGTRALNRAVVTSGKLSRTGQARIPTPTTSGTANGAAGNVSIIAASGKVQADLHADDITGGANGLAGCVIYIFARDTDTDEDKALVRKGDFDTTTAGDVTGLTAMTAATYSAYAAFKAADGTIGPWSARTTVVVS